MGNGGVGAEARSIYALSHCQPSKSSSRPNEEVTCSTSAASCGCALPIMRLKETANRVHRPIGEVAQAAVVAIVSRVE